MKYQNLTIWAGKESSESRRELIESEGSRDTENDDKCVV